MPEARRSRKFVAAAEKIQPAMSDHDPQGYSDFNTCWLQQITVEIIAWKQLTLMVLALALRSAGPITSTNENDIEIASAGNSDEDVTTWSFNCKRYPGI